MSKGSESVVLYVVLIPMVLVELIIIWIVDVYVIGGYINIGKIDLHAWTWVTALLCMAVTYAYTRIYRKLSRNSAVPIADVAKPTVSLNAGVVQAGANRHSKKANHVPNMRSLCPWCFLTVNNSPACEECGYPDIITSPVTLAAATVLNDNYVVGRFLGKLGGFGITYLAYDQDLAMRVAVKEYFPRDLVGRRPDGTTLQPHSVDDGQTFHEGMNKFIEEARMLALFDHPSVVRVRTFFKQYGTAYIVMDYYSGMNLEEYVISSGGRLKVLEAISLIMPVLDGLREVHAKGILHRDIKPQNIYITAEGRVILLDFGAARVSSRDCTRSTQVTFTPGFAPLEQAAGESRQGPWTDLYSTAAVFWYMMTGHSPQRVELRLENDELMQRIETTVRHPHMRSLLQESLRIDPANRMQDIAQFQNRLLQIRNTM